MQIPDNLLRLKGRRKKRRTLCDSRTLPFLNVDARRHVLCIPFEASGNALKNYWEIHMPSFDPELIQVMRSALDEVMTKVPAEYSTIEVKARLAEFILKAAAHGQINYDGLVAAATDQINAIVGLLT